MIASTTPRRAILSAVAFFGTLWILSVGYSAYSGLASASAWQGLTSAAWNQVKDNLDDLNSRLSNFSFASGNVGIGKSPSAKLDVNGALRVSWARPSIIGTSDSMNAWWISTQGDSGSWAFWYHAKWSAGTDRGGFWFLGTADALSFYYVGSSYSSPTVTVFPSNGNVWIGTASPSQKLEVTGIVYSTSGGFKFPDGTIQTTATTWGWVPTGAIMAFNLASCPSGWSEYVAARGRFLRGIDSTGANDSVRAAGNIQNDAPGSHSHSFSLNWKNNNGIAAPGFVVWWSWLVWVQSYSTVAAWDVETRPKNVAVLYCVKN